ncbi:MAG TPA: argininosuccinate lyase [Candidatus Pullichristensenella avicola]|nr:argininosuccinate lyase [Candidatus Pullichristensenella avicola]
MKLWQGRLAGDVDERLNRLNQSIGFDARMYRQDIAGSIAHARMLGKIGVLAPEETSAIVGGLQGILADIDAGKLQIDMTCEDIHTFVEAELTRRIGQPGKKLHTARSRNDQVALDLRLYLGDEIERTREKCALLIQALCDVAEKHLDTVMPGYTHLQRAQPVTLAHHLMAYAQMLLRDRERLAQCRARTLTSPLGAGALAGTGYALDRQFVAEQLGMNGVTENSLDAVADRDFVLELLADFSILMAHLSRFAEEICLWCSWEFRFMALDDRFSTGSSIMPQKKNPDLAELIRGKTGRVYGALTTLLTAVKGLPLAYNKDLQEDKEAVFDALDTVDLCLDVLPPMLKTATFFPERMRAAAAAGFLNATDCADYLVSKGVPFRDAYAISGRLVRLCVEKGETLDTLPLEEYRKVHPAFDSDVYSFIDLANCVSKRKVYGGPAPEAVRVQIANARAGCARAGCAGGQTLPLMGGAYPPHAQGADALGCVPGER